MSGGDFDITTGAARIRVEGLGRTLRALSKAGADAEDMRDLMHSIGMLVVTAAHPPVASGALASTMRAGRGKTKAVVRAGGRGVPYAGVIHYGWPKRNIRPQGFLTAAVQQQQGAIYAALTDGIGHLLDTNDLT